MEILNGIVDSVLADVAGFVLRSLAPVVGAFVVFFVSSIWRRRKVLVAILSDHPDSPESPVESIRAVFNRLLVVEKALVELQFSRRLDTDSLFLVSGVFLLYVLLALVISTGQFPVGAAVLTYLSISFLGSALLGLCNPSAMKRCMRLVIFFPYLAAQFMVVGVVIDKRARIVESCRWLLLMAIPSTNHAHKVLSRRSEHLHAIRAMIQVLQPLLDEQDIRARVDYLLVELRDIAETIEKRWSNLIDPMTVLGIAELNQVTIDPDYFHEPKKGY